MGTILLASNNRGKLNELRAMQGIKLILPTDIDLKLDVVEDGKSYAENAAKKAQAFASASGLIALGDDSGLEVDALGAAPGLYSARYSPKEGANDADRRAYLLKQLQGKARPWTASFHSTLCLALPSGETHFAAGTCSGEIIPEERGSRGFGYDAIFQLSENGPTMAELSMDEKNQWSHRARAVAALKPSIQEILNLSR
jgi:XTP/dITP diphosphohydrolase